MKTLIRPWLHVALCAALLVLAAAGARAQAQPVRSTGNPYGGLRGNSERGLPLRGASSRGVSDRQTARERKRPVSDDVATSRPAPGGAAPTTPTPRGALPAPVPMPDRLLPRLLTPSAGPVLRGLARLVNGRWTILTADGLRVLPAGEVRRALLERDVLAELGARRRSLDPADPAARLALARWTLEQGLVDEGLAELDELLAQDDDGFGALELLREADLPPPVARDAQHDEDGVGRLLDRGARSSPAVQELLILELVPFGARDRNTLERLLRERRDATRGAQRAFAERALRRLFPGAQPAVARGSDAST